MAFEGGTPEGWETHEIGEYLSLTTGFAFKSTQFVDDPDAGPPLIRIRDLKTHSPERYFAGEIPDGYDVEPGEYLIGMDGEFEAVVWQGEKALLNQRVLKFDTANPDQLDRSFLFYRIQPELRRLEESIAGTTVKHLSTKHLKELRVDLPPLAEQKKIAEILGAVDDAITKTKAVVESSRLLLAALVNEEFRRVASSFDGEPPSGWKHTTLGKCFLQSKSKGSSDLPIASVTMDRGLVLRSSVDRIVRSELAPEAHLRVNKGQIAYNMMRMWQGVCGVATKDYNVSPAYVVIQPIEGIDPWYFYYAFKSSPVKRLLEGYSQGIVDDRLRLYYHHFSDIPVNIPSFEHQRGRSAIFRQLDNIIETENQSVEALSTIKVRMLSDLLSGRKRASPTPPSAEIIPFPSRPTTAAAYICRRHQGNKRYGSEKLQKILHFCQYEAVSGRDFPRVPQRQRAGPYDPEGRRDIVREMQERKWFREDTSGDATVYKPLSELSRHAVIYRQQFSDDERTSVNRIIDLLKPLTTDECGVYATLYASWNDFLIDGHSPSDDDIVNDVLTNWTTNKADTPRREWKAGLKWLRDNNLVPKGVGPKTTRAGGQSFLSLGGENGA